MSKLDKDRELTLEEMVDIYLNGDDDEDDPLAEAIFRDQFGYNTYELFDDDEDEGE